MIEIPHALFNWYLYWLRFKSKSSSSIMMPTRNEQLSIPVWYLHKYVMSSFTISGRVIMTHQYPKQTNRHIIFLHGGAFCGEAISSHWTLMDRLQTSAHAHLSFIDYPLAPEYQFEEIQEMCLQSILKLQNAFPDHEFHFIGDSAGGGLALCLALHLRDKQLPLPKSLILLSPWVDLSLENPELKLQKKEAFLTIKGLKQAAKWYAGSTQLNHHKISPINAKLEKLPSIQIFAGSYELLQPDIKRLVDMLNDSGNNVQYHEYQKMQHDWALFPIREAKQLVNDVAIFIHEIE